MHELLLHAPVPFSRHHQVLSILAGLAAMQPIPLHEEVQLYKPDRLPEASRSVQVGAVQGVNVPKAQNQMQAAMAGDLFYLRVVQESKADDHHDGTGGKESSDQSTENDSGRMEMDGEQQGDSMQVDVEPPKQQTGNPQPSSSLKDSSPQAPLPPPVLQFRDVPEAGRQKDRAVTMRFIADTPITSGSASAFMKALNYSPVSLYRTEGHRLTYNNINLHLYRVRVPVPSAQLSVGEASQEQTESKPTGSKLLDESGAYLLEASMKVLDGSKVELMARGASELLDLRETLKGVVGLEMVERLALDTRVK